MLVYRVFELPNPLLSEQGVRSWPCSEKCGASNLPTSSHAMVPIIFCSLRWSQNQSAKRKFSDADLRRFDQDDRDRKVFGSFQKTIHGNATKASQRIGVRSDPGPQAVLNHNVLDVNAIGSDEQNRRPVLPSALLRCWRRIHYGQTCFDLQSDLNAFSDDLFFFGGDIEKKLRKGSSLRDEFAAEGRMPNNSRF